MRRILAVVLVASLSAVAACGTTAPDGEFVEIPGVGSTRIDVPRPTSGVSAVCDEDPLPGPNGDSLEDRVAALRDIGFFADRDDRSDAEIATEVEADLADLWGDALAADDPLFELAVAETDVGRVWWRDLEADVAEENQVYVETLVGWAAISLGSFEPAGIEETWDGPAGPVRVRFTHAGRSTELAPAYLEDWIDPTIVTGVNGVIDGSGRQLYLYAAFDQTAYVVSLTDVERGALEARGWCFE